MSTPSARLCIPAVVLALVIVGCGGGADPTIDTSSAAVTPPTVDLPVVTADDTPSGTDDIPLAPPVISADMPLPPPVISTDIPTPLLIEVIVGVDSGPERLESVPLGSTLTLSVTNPTSDDEFHLHGYDLGDGASVPAGQVQTYTFTAGEAGEFELESHETGDVLLVLSVA